MLAVVLPTTNGLYTDEVFSAKDLNRRAAEVLDKALKSPVTISRKNEQFALLRRDQVGRLFEAVSTLTNAIEILAAAWVAARGGSIAPAVSWIKQFDAEELAEFAKELVAAIEIANRNASAWEDVRTLIFQWERSAEALRKGILTEAMREEPDEVELAEPAAIKTEKRQSARRRRTERR